MNLPVPPSGHRLCVAPMMECTDRHDRYLLRLLSRHALLYTEMIPAAALCRGDAPRLLAHHPAEQPLALQLGGSDPAQMAAGAALAASHGFREVNINAGCPSDRVQAGRFGACLMAEPARVADCVGAMRGAAPLPVTVKTRIGIDHRDSWEDLVRFVCVVAAAGCRTFIVHARKAWLRGLSPRENRELPPLRHDVVHRLKREFPELEIVLNGGIATLAQAQAQLARVDGVMLGRAAYRNPYLLAGADARLFADPHPVPSRAEAARRYADYAGAQLAAGTPLPHLTRHLLGLFQGVRGARAWRRHLSEAAQRPGAGVGIIEAALGHVGESDPAADPRLAPAHAAAPAHAP